ncbi:hypothetical protein K2173_012375 [Erythroxylum novogranatense]|uniref:PsbP C-terminal domain-containing protein n=1 Tax=Erythroxylum novogranatense TaxID=1862640 RepID=A0AAV8UAX9_9ROSI|nr:hypothetical protein K2173_012375 [Erythroxylum novogranatense]
MDTVVSPSARLSSTVASLRSPPQVHLTTKNLSILVSILPSKPLLTTLAATVTAATILTTSPPSLSESARSFQTYYDTAASAANYDGYGDNSDKKASVEYVYDVPDGWKERLVSKVEKGTNGIDSEFYNPKKRSEREYVISLSGFEQLASIDEVLNNLALSDLVLQDWIDGADSVVSEVKKDGSGQLYYVYEIDGLGKHSLIKVTCTRNKLYAHFVNAPRPEWNRDVEILRHLHDSFKTVGSF